MEKEQKVSDEQLGNVICCVGINSIKKDKRRIDK